MLFNWLIEYAISTKKSDMLYNWLIEYAIATKKSDPKTIEIVWASAAHTASHNCISLTP